MKEGLQAIPKDLRPRLKSQLMNVNMANRTPASRTNTRFNPLFLLMLQSITDKHKDSYLQIPPQKKSVSSLQRRLHWWRRLFGRKF